MEVWASYEQGLGEKREKEDIKYKARKSSFPCPLSMASLAEDGHDSESRHLTTKGHFLYLFGPFQVHRGKRNKPAWFTGG